MNVFNQVLECKWISYNRVEVLFICETEHIIEAWFLLLNRIQWNINLLFTDEYEKRRKVEYFPYLAAPLGFGYDSIVIMRLILSGIL